MPGIDGPGVLSALPDLSPRWRRTVGPAQPRGGVADVPHGSQSTPPNRAPTAGVWRQGARPFRILPYRKPRPRFCVSRGDPNWFGSLAFRWRAARKAVPRLGPSAQPPPGPLYVTSDRDAPAARPGPSRHRPARGFTQPKTPALLPPRGVWGGHNFNPVGVAVLSLGQGEVNEPPP